MSLSYSHKLITHPLGEMRPMPLLAEADLMQSIVGDEELAELGTIMITFLG